ncbi:MAG: 3-hydroxyacyl-CoA dehydrogenase, partial [Candidatus Rokuibacteriota bacterium]
MPSHRRRGGSGEQPGELRAGGVRQGLLDGLAQGLRDAGAKALVIMGAGRTFSAGADIREFDRPLAPPDLNDVIGRIEASPKLVVAALHGTALGGGLEVALGCHYRCALRSTRVGFPEVTLGLVPGAGGTQRLPRLVGAELALRIITSGEPMPAERAHSLGRIDELIDGDLRAGAVAFAERLVAEGRPLRRLSAIDDKLEAARRDPGIFDRFRQEIERPAR